jgi:hypothetical protein
MTIIRSYSFVSIIITVVVTVVVTIAVAYAVFPRILQFPRSDVVSIIPSSAAVAPCLKPIQRTTGRGIVLNGVKMK